MNTLKDHFNSQMKRNSIECTINYVTKSKCFFKEIKDMKGYQDMKYMFTYVNQCKQGDIIECIHKRYVVIQLDQSYNNVYDRYIIRELTHVVKVEDDFNIPVFFKDVILKMNETTIEFDTTKMIMYAPYTNTQLVNSRFIFKGQAWKIKSENRMFTQGLVIYNLEADTRTEEESKQGFEELEPTKPKIHTLKIDIPTKIEPNTNISINFEIYQKEEIQNNIEDVKIKSGNTNIIEVSKENKKIKINTINCGETTITVQYMEYIKIFYVTVEKKELKIIGDEELKLQTYQEYSISEEVENIEWKINGNVSYLKIIKVDNKTCKLYTKERDNLWKEFILECWSNGNKVTEMKIEIINVI